MGESADSIKMGFWEHVEVLRFVLLKSLGVIAVFTAGFFFALPWLFDHVILAPCRPDFPLYTLLTTISSLSNLFPDLSITGHTVELINIQLASQFFIHMTTSFWLGVVFSFPFIIFFIWNFISPGLYPREKQGIKKAFLIGNIMFYLGVATGYFLVFPLTLRFLADYQISSSIPNQISLDSYMDNFMVLILVMGIIFELPLLAWLIGKAGIINKSFFKKFRRHAIVILLALAAIVTPTGDPFTLLVVFFPIYSLWELSIFLVPSPNTD